MKISLSDRFWKLNVKLNTKKEVNEEFQYAAITGNLWRLKYIMNNAKPGKLDVQADDNKAIRWSANGGFDEVIDFLREHGANIRAKEHDAIVKAAGNGQIKTLKKLIKIGLDINTQEGMALRVAVRNDKDLMVKFLIDNGIDLKKFGMKAYNIAVNNNCKKSIDVLEKAFNNRKPFKFRI